LKLAPDSLTDDFLSMTWEGTDDDRMAVLVLAEDSPPVLETVTGSSHMLALDSRDSGYCFAVAYMEVVAAAGEGGAPEEAGDHPVIGPGFTPLLCSGGASADTVMLEP
jgi:hypothetical protein